MDNSQLQLDEIEALTAIFAEDWVVENETDRVYSITLNSDGVNDESAKSITIQIRLPEDYPLDAPPLYTLSAPWMSRKEKMSLMNDLEALYGKHAGESIVYMWIEKAREFLNGNDEVESSRGEPSAGGSAMLVQDTDDFKGYKNRHKKSQVPVFVSTGEVPFKHIFQ